MSSPSWPGATAHDTVHEISRWLGHTSIKTTVDIHGHLVPAAWERCRRSPTGPPRLLDRRWIQPAESGCAQVAALVSMFRFNV
ncbi:hypothetical protein [Streptomyces lydicus]|uniref:hypothetical protein n=1 Tax=Streptomyces lydicus TaxID=47763 RepID=UPI003716CCED